MIKSVLIWIALSGLIVANQSASCQLREVPLDRVAVKGGFLSRFLATNRQVTVPDILDKCAASGAISNFAMAAGLKQGAFSGMWNNDEVVYKAIEAASYVLHSQYDKNLDVRVDSVIAIIALAQEEDGFINSLLTMQRKGLIVPEGYDKPSRLLLLYLFGHLYEAAVAHVKATGKTSLLNVAMKNADYVAARYGRGKLTDVPEHQEIELALIRLHEVTGNQTYLDLCRFFVHERGQLSGRPGYGSFAQDHAPIEDQEEAVGQAPRATYFYSAVTDLARIDGAQKYEEAMDRLWHDVVAKKMYLHGGIGSKHENEGFSKGYDLPNLTAYAEVCAAVSFSMWNHRMFLLHRDGKYLDVLERTFLNNFLAGTSLAGNTYFYACPLSSDGKFAFNGGYIHPSAKRYRDHVADRKDWFFCACCPPNYARFLASFPALMYASDDTNLFINFFFSNEAKIAVGNQSVDVTVHSDYPWDGRIAITVGPESNAPFSLKVRIPGWAVGQPVTGDLYRYTDSTSQSIRVSINGSPIAYTLDKGFLTVSRTWSRGDQLLVDLPMPVRRVVSHRLVGENRSRVALERGPIVYCFEQADNGPSIIDAIIADSAPVHAVPEKGVLGSLVTLTVDGNSRRPETALKAIPYFAWCNRGPGAMAVWMRRR